MATPKTLALFIPILFFCLPPSFSDPDPIQDFCIPTASNTPLKCKDPSNVTANDFVFSGLRAMVPIFSPDIGLSAIAVNPTLFPALNTLGMSFVHADLKPGEVNPPHYHQRATEVALVLEGRVYSGFVDSGGRVYAKVVEKGDVMVFPRGMIHFQMNVGDSVASIYGCFNSQQPGLTRVSTALFGAAVEEKLLETTFGLSRCEIVQMRKKFGGS